MSYYCKAEDVNKFDNVQDVQEIIDEVVFVNNVLVYYPSTKDSAEYHIPEGTKGILSDAFRDATKIQNIYIPSSCMFIGMSFIEFNITSIPYKSNYCFCNVENFFVDKENKSFKDVCGVLYSKDLSILYQYPLKREDISFIIPEKVVEIGEYAFAYSNVQSISLPDSLRFIRKGAFYNAHISNLALPSGLEEIGDEAFYGNRLTNIEFPETLLRIGASAFESNYISCVSLPNNIEYLGTFCFFGNPIMESTIIRLPKSLTYIGVDIFQYGFSSEEYWMPVYSVSQDSYALQWVKNYNMNYIVQ